MSQFVSSTHMFENGACTVIGSYICTCTYVSLSAVPFIICTFRDLNRLFVRINTMKLNELTLYPLNLSTIQTQPLIL